MIRSNSQHKNRNVFEAIEARVEKASRVDCPIYLAENKKFEEALDLAFSIDQSNQDRDKNRGSVHSDRVTFSLSRDDESYEPFYRLEVTGPEPGKKTVYRTYKKSGKTTLMHRWHTKEKLVLSHSEGSARVYNGYL